MFAYSCWVEFSQIHPTIITWSLSLLTLTCPVGKTVNVEVPQRVKKPHSNIMAIPCCLIISTTNFVSIYGLQGVFLRRCQGSQTPETLSLLTRDLKLGFTKMLYTGPNNERHLRFMSADEFWRCRGWLLQPPPFTRGRPKSQINWVQFMLTSTIFGIFSCPPFLSVQTGLSHVTSRLNHSEVQTKQTGRLCLFPTPTPQLIYLFSSTSFWVFLVYSV